MSTSSRWRKSRPSSPDEVAEGDEMDDAYNISCPTHGQVEIGKRAYDYQMKINSNEWACPKCGAIAEFDDDTLEIIVEGPDRLDAESPS